MTKCATAVLGLVFTAICSTGWTQELKGSLTVHVAAAGHAIPAGFYGLMTEEINHSYDGGLYAELIQNRSFRDSTKEPLGWSVAGGTATLEPGSTPDLKVDLGPNTQIVNSGFWGVPVKPNTKYRVIVRAKGSLDSKGPITLAIRSESGSILASGVIRSLGTDWQTNTVVLKTGNVPATINNRFSIEASGSGAIWLNYVSLFPPTFHGRSNGLRPDLMQLMGAMRPSFLRLPGGNYLEGNHISSRFDWKATIGPVIDRTGHMGPWGYRSSDGLGLLEFLEWCEDLDMEPLLAVFAGYSLEQDHVDPGPKLVPFIDDALDEIEYVTGDVSTTWGKRRAEDGHPKPFHLTYVEVGNEDAFDRSASYDGRFGQFFDAIKHRYPKLKLIATTPVKSRVPDLVDDHYYRTSADMARDSGHYDSYPRTGPKIFVGEWASTEGTPTPTLQAALGDAAWLTGLERDSDVVLMESYAPLLVNVNQGASQWGTNLIGYNAGTSFGSPSFFVQSMFAQYTGVKVLPSDLKVDQPPKRELTLHGSVGIGTWQTDAEFKDMQVTHDGQTENFFSAEAPLTGWKPVQGTWVADQSGGAIRQTSGDQGTLATRGSVDWTNYTYTLKARRMGGDEGFFIPFHVIDAENYWFWNVGGWGNSRTAIQAKENGGSREVGRATRMKVETGRWYDVKIELDHRHVRCYLDGKLVTEVVESERPPVNPIYVAASKDVHGAVYLKVVNASDEDADLDLTLEGVRSVAVTYAGLELAGKRSDQNTIQNPDLSSPKPVHLAGAGKSLHHVFPARSVTVLKSSG